MISEFSKRHTKIKELESELRAYREIKEKMKDCGEELEIAFDTDEDQVDVKFGDSFFVTTVTDAKVMCEDKDKEMDVEIENLSSQLKVLQGEVDVLKKKLYSRFGTQINLEENN